jgi:hypothetical protein
MISQEVRNPISFRLGFVTTSIYRTCKYFTFFLLLSLRRMLIEHMLLQIQFMGIFLITMATGERTFVCLHMIVHCALTSSKCTICVLLFGNDLVAVGTHKISIVIVMIFKHCVAIWFYGRRKIQFFI